MAGGSGGGRGAAAAAMSTPRPRTLPPAGRPSAPRGACVARRCGIPAAAAAAEAIDDGYFGEETTPCE
eukprot:366278-Chlamydomonas_euryale.AAC.31